VIDKVPFKFKLWFSVIDTTLLFVVILFQVVPLKLELKVIAPSKPSVLPVVVSVPDTSVRVVPCKLAKVPKVTLPFIKTPLDELRGLATVVDDHVPPVIYIGELPAIEPLVIDTPLPVVNICDVVLLMVVLFAELFKVPLIFKSDVSVIVLLLVIEKEFGHILPFVFIVEFAVIINDEAPAIV